MRPEMPGSRRVERCIPLQTGSWLLALVESDEIEEFRTLKLTNRDCRDSIYHLHALEHGEKGRVLPVDAERHHRAIFGEKHLGLMSHHLRLRGFVDVAVISDAHHDALRLELCHGHDLLVKLILRTYNH